MDGFYEGNFDKMLQGAKEVDLGFLQKYAVRVMTPPALQLLSPRVLARGPMGVKRLADLMRGGMKDPVTGRFTEYLSTKDGLRAFIFGVSRTQKQTYMNDVWADINTMRQLKDNESNYINKLLFQGKRREAEKEIRIYNVKSGARYKNLLNYIKTNLLDHSKNLIEKNPYRISIKGRDIRRRIKMGKRGALERVMQK
jgi:hypothetical protein